MHAWTLHLYTERALGFLECQARGNWWAIFSSQSIQLSLHGIYVQKPTCGKITLLYSGNHTKSKCSALENSHLHAGSNFPLFKWDLWILHMNLVLVKTDCQLSTSHFSFSSRTDSGQMEAPCLCSTEFNKIFQPWPGYEGNSNFVPIKSPCFLKFPSAMVNSGVCQTGAKSDPAIFHCSDTCFQKRKNLPSQSFSWYKSAPFHRS